MCLSLHLLNRASVRLALLVGSLHGAVVVVVVVVVSSHSSGHLGFGTQTIQLPSLLAIVLQQPVALQDLLALVVLAVLPRVAVFGQRLEGQLGLAWLDVLL